MDSITDKFSVFDFFNLIIAGAIFGLGVGICNYSHAVSFCAKVAELISKSDFILIIAIILFIGCALITGTVINEIAHWFFDVNRHWEKNIIETCLNKNQLIKNDTKLRIFRKKVANYFHERDLNTSIDLSDISIKLSAEECSTYFAYCIYYLHVRKQDMKTEKLRETQGLAELLSCVFALIPIFSIIILIFQLLFLPNANLNPKFILATYAICALFSCAFIRRYKRTTENRIRMVLAVYDACVDMEELNREEHNHVQAERVRSQLNTSSKAE